MPKLNLTNVLIALAVVVVVVKFSTQIRGFLVKIPVVGSLVA